VLLITSRETRRWLIPKGNPIRGLSAYEAAAQEAYEEAGVSGLPCPTPLGGYTYWKRRRDGSLRRADVSVYPLAVTAQAEDWPEQDERDTHWFDLPQAAAAVDEPELSRLIAGFRAPEPTQGWGERLVGWTRAQGGRMPITRWFQALLPQQGRFFDQFEEHATTLVMSADALARLFQDGPGAIATQVAAIREQENRADDITRDVLRDVRRFLLTPFDRTAITGLIGAMNDAIDQMNGVAKSITLYEFTAFAPQMRAMGGIIVEAARVAAEVMPLLRDIGRHDGRIVELTARLIELEGHADEIHDDGLKALFKGCGDTQTMAFIVGREIYGQLERVVDRFEDVANEVQGLVLDHA
jgi:uncharacterized protein Yka (UPF0111/DUF47 family)/ADP-ribose pyrophosphatase YjhB (NUDIX family)